MSLGQVLQSRGAEDRACAELNLLKNENGKRVRIESTMTSARMSEKDARAAETDGSKNKYADSWYQLQSAEEAVKSAESGKNAAIWGAISSIASAGAQAAASPNGFNASAIFNIATTAFSGIMSIIGAYLAREGAIDERDMVKTIFGAMSDSAKEDDKNMKALDGNPGIN